MKKQKAPIPTLLPGYYLIDSHCHLDMDSYKADLDKVLQKARTFGIQSIISIGIDEKSSIAAIALAHKYPFVKATVGVHPHDVEQIDDSTYSRLKKLVEDNRKQVVGFGEIGLDYVKNYSPRSVQLQKFQEQLSLAKEIKLPVIIHDREAHEDCMAILEAAAPFPERGVMHCFSGDMKLAKKVLDLGFYISVPGVVTFKNGLDLQGVVSKIPLDSMLLETDGPFLSPVPWRGKRNEPSYVAYTAQKVADLRGISIEAVAEHCSKNTLSLFRYTLD
ncbi:MAG: hydrolase TatD [Desulfocapsa sp.]|nr:MAG: hydrolase TatD [Desulfocapsa sp.]